jgi:hypothetical protein
MMYPHSEYVQKACPPPHRDFSKNLSYPSDPSPLQPGAWLKHKQTIKSSQGWIQKKHHTCTAMIVV